MASVLVPKGSSARLNAAVEEEYFANGDRIRVGAWDTAVSPFRKAHGSCASHRA